jgi:CheY-like chemotaxis protein
MSLDAAAQSLLRGQPGVAQAMDQLGEARAGAECIRLILQDLRMFSREGGEERKLVELRELAVPAIRMMRHLLHNRARLEEDYGPVPRVRASESRLGQVLLNLLVNAAQATPEGDPGRHVVRIRTRTAPDGRAQVEVSDTGRGILPEVLPHIFEPFFTTKPSVEGTGLGLSICQQIVQVHGGVILVHSEPGKGSVFTMLLPAASERSVSPAPEPRERVEGSQGGARRGRILIVDDEPRLTQSMRLLLEPSHEVVTTSCGQEALELMASGQHFDVVVCDLQMPGTTGMELYARLREQEPGLAERLVFMSGGAYTAAASHFVRTVPNRVLEKPVRPELLLATINAAMAPRQPRPGV